MHLQRRLAFYFDYLSPYAYLAWNDLRQRIARLEDQSGRQVEFSPRPVLLAALLDAGGQLGPAEVPAKRRFVARDVLRRARRLGVPLVWPGQHPFRPVTALRLSLPEVGGEQQSKIIDTLWKAGWREGLNLGDRETLLSVLSAAGLPADELMAKAEEDDAKAALRLETERAVEAGVFGVPTVVLDDEELIWGADRLDDVFGLLTNDPMLEIDEASFEEVIRKPLGVRRRRLTDAAEVVARAPAAAATAPVLRIGAGQQEAAERVKAIFSAAPFVQHLGAKLTCVDEGLVETVLPLRPDHAQQDGFVHAGALATLADHTAGAAAGAAMPADRVPLSVEFKINMLRPAKGDQLRCRSTVLRAGRRIVVAESEVFATAEGQEKLVSKATITLAAVEAPQ